MHTVQARPISFLLRDTVYKKISKMLSLRVIGKIKFPKSSSILPVPKSNGKYIDFELIFDELLSLGKMSSLFHASM